MGKPNQKVTDGHTDAETERWQTDTESERWASGLTKSKADRQVSGLCHFITGHKDGWQTMARDPEM
jgi:hypothetical protein